MSAFGTTSDHCVNCGSRSHTFWAKVQQWELVKCEGCSLVYVFPQIEPELLQHLYSSQTGYHQPLIQRDPAVMEGINKQANELLQLVLHEVSGGKLLDIGCSTGIFLEHCKEAGFEAEGFEPNIATANYARQRGLSLPHVETLEELKANDYDVITLFDVLEHVLNPPKLLTDCFRLLKPGGRLFIHCPNVDSFLSIATLRLFYPLTNQYAYSKIPYHIFEFSPHTLYDMLNRNGYTLLGIQDVFCDMKDMLDCFEVPQPQKLAQFKASLLKKNSSTKLPPHKTSMEFEQIISYLIHHTYKQLIVEGHKLTEELNFGAAGMFANAVVNKDEQHMFQIFNQLQIPENSESTTQFCLSDLSPLFQLEENEMQAYLSYTFEVFTDLAIHHLEKLGFKSVKKKTLSSKLSSQALNQERIELEDLNSFNYLCLYSQDNKTGWKESLISYLRNFTMGEEVILYVYVMPNEAHETIEDELMNVIESHGFNLEHIPDISVLGADIQFSEHEEQQLFHLVDAILLPFHQLWGLERYLALSYQSPSKLITHQVDDKIDEENTYYLTSLKDLKNQNPLEPIMIELGALQHLMNKMSQQD